MTITIPAYCPTCKRLFRSNAIAIGGNANVVMENCATNCPRGHDAVFLDGSYSVRDNILQIASTSPETLRLLRSIAEQAIAGKIDKEEASNRIVELAPSLSPLLQGSKSDLLPYLALLVYLIVELAKAATSSSPSQTIINNWPTIKNEITIQQPIAKDGELAPRDSGINANHKKHSKRQERRLRGKERERARRGG